MSQICRELAISDAVGAGSVIAIVVLVGYMAFALVPAGAPPERHTQPEDPLAVALKRLQSLPFIHGQAQDSRILTKTDSRAYDLATARAHAWAEVYTDLQRLPEHAGITCTPAGRFGARCTMLQYAEPSPFDVLLVCPSWETPAADCQRLEDRTRRFKS